MKTLVFRLFSTLFLIALLFLKQSAQPVYAANYIVNTLADNTTAGDGLCTLREAIQSANNAGNGDCGANSSADDTITFSVSGTITLGATLPNIVSGQGTLTIDGNGVITLSGNVQAIRVNQGANLTLQNLTISNTTGGAIYNFRGTVTVTNCTFSGNSACKGGGIYNFFSTLTVSNSTFSRNSASGTYDCKGGGIYNYGGTVTVTNSTFSGNSAPGSYGGGIYNESGTLTVTNSTFFGNSASGTYGWGGGIYNGSEGILTVTHSTFSGNSANTGGGVNRSGGTVTLRNTIVANSTSGGNCSGLITNGGGNLVWGDTSCPGINADPKLGALANNGGPTQTMKLGSDSAAIDRAVAANCPSTDQRGENRDDLNCDIGAFELKMSDSNWVRRTVSNTSLATFGPARAGMQYSGTDPGLTTVAKVTNWTNQPENAIGAWWDILPTTGSGLNLTLALCYSDAERRGLTESNLRFWRYSGGSWSQIGDVPTFSGTSPNRCAQITGVTDLSRWTLATGNPGGAPTAVTLSSFRAITPTFDLAAWFAEILRAWVR